MMKAILAINMLYTKRTCGDFRIIDVIARNALTI